jgi:hypothetical protein
MLDESLIFQKSSRLRINVQGKPEQELGLWAQFKKTNSESGGLVPNETAKANGVHLGYD